jgi:hypothetical protein
MKRTSNSAYPKVISNLGALSDNTDGRIAINMIRFMNHYARTVGERQRIIEFFKRDKYVPPQKCVDIDSITGQTILNDLPEVTAAFKEAAGGTMKTSMYMHMMNDFFAVGFANTIGYAHANTGDTMTAVMIGGLRTVMNGDFEIFPGDLVQFYWSAPKFSPLVSI